jgi:hypothetical protein
MRIVGLVLGLMGVSLIGCGGGASGGLGKPIAQFPSRDDLEDVAESEAAPLRPVKTLEVPRWDVAPESLVAEGSYPAETPLDSMIASAAAERSATLSPPLRCAGMEAARFFTKHGAYPGDGLRDHIVRRCGSVLPSLTFQTLDMAVPDEVPEAEFAQSMNKAIAGMLAQRAKPGVHLGAGYARGGGRVSVVAFAGVPTARLDAFTSLIGEGTSVTLSGELPRHAEHAIALVNHGEFGVEICEPDRSVKRPRFSVTCPVAPNDATTRIEIASSKRGQVLMHQDVQLMVRRTDDAGLVYEPSTYGGPSKAASSSAFRKAFVGALNRVRERAGLGGLTVENEQSAMSDRLAPHFFSASESGDSERTDVIALGLLAGWDVDGMIREGGIFTGALHGSRSPEHFLSHALESPLGRQVLLDRDISRAAVGAALLEPTGIVTIVNTYAFFGSQDHRADEDAVFAELSKLRAARGLPPPTRLERGDALDRCLRRIATNTAGTVDAVEEALQTISEEQSRSMSGFTLETHDLKNLEISDELLRNAPLAVAVGVTHYKPEGAAWGQYVVVLVTEMSGPGVRTAESAPAKSAKRPGIFAGREQTPSAN